MRDASRGGPTAVWRGGARERGRRIWNGAHGSETTEVVQAPTANAAFDLLGPLLRALLFLLNQPGQTQTGHPLSAAAPTPLHRNRVEVRGISAMLVVQEQDLVAAPPACTAGSARGALHVALGPTRCVAASGLSRAGLRAPWSWLCPNT